MLINSVVVEIFSKLFSCKLFNWPWISVIFSFKLFKLSITNSLSSFNDSKEFRIFWLRSVFLFAEFCNSSNLLLLSKSVNWVFIVLPIAKAKLIGGKNFKIFLIAF